MRQQDLQRHLEFLILFLSVPDKKFYEDVFNGATPLGLFEAAEDVENFCVDMAATTTALFVNSPRKRPVYPLATEFIAAEDGREDYLSRLTDVYNTRGKTPRAYPPDHLRVQYEFVLFLLQDNDVRGAADFYVEFIKGWTAGFVDSILKRKLPEMFIRIARMILLIGSQLEALGGSMNDNKETPDKNPQIDKLLRLIPESVYDGVLVIDDDFNIVYANERFAGIYGVNPEDFIGKKCTETIGFDHCHNSCPHRDIMSRKSDYSGHNLYCQACSAGPYCVSASPLMDEDGNVTGIVELYRNMKKLGMYIGSLEDTNVALNVEKARLHKILDDIADGYYCATPEGRVTSVNPKLQKLLGKTSQEMTGRYCGDVICGESCKTDCPREWAVRKKQNVINSHQHLIIGDELIPYDKSIILIEGKDGEVESIIGVINKVSETILLRDEAKSALEYFDIITENPSMKDIINLVKEAAPTDAPVLITGETGTGKELVARAVRQLSHRADSPFVKINCSALTESLLESELFGHAKGAFTGAVANYAGKFKKADGGTIFLDEVEEMSPGLQAKLLRVIEEQEFEPVGSNRLENVNVRLIAAANQDLASLIESGRFRSDLYYRLNVIRIVVPPLRERAGDIPALIKHRLKLLREKYRKDIVTVSTRALDVLVGHDWPGNIRQLFGALEYAFLRANGERIERADLPEEVYVSAGRAPARKKNGHTDDKQKIENLIAAYPGDRRRVAQELGISRTTLWRRIQQLGIDVAPED